MGSAWKVAYADFVTALMAFFLVMWVLGMTENNPALREAIAEYFAEEAYLPTDAAQAAARPGGGMGAASTKLELSSAPMSEAQRSNLAIAKKLSTMLMADAVPQSSSGISSDDVGVQLRVNNDAMFQPGSAAITTEGAHVLDSVYSILKDYNVYLVVRGHADSGEISNSLYPSPWELSAARAAASIRYLVDKGIKPTSLRAVAYGDTRPLAPGQGASNRRVEFHFHRPEAMTYSIVY